MQKRLYRSKKEKIFLGVCGGIAEYFNIDPSIVRLLFVLLVLFTGGTMLILYLIAGIIIPEEPSDFFNSPEEGQKEPKDISHKDRGEEFLGWLLLIIGALLLGKTLGWFILPFRAIFSIILIILGVLLLLAKK